MNLNEKITFYREKKGLTKSQLAREIDVSPAYITMIENGTKRPSPNILIRLSRVFNLNPIDLDENLSQDELDSYYKKIESLKFLFEYGNKEISPGLFDEERISRILNSFGKHYINEDTYEGKLFTFYDLIYSIRDNTRAYYDNISETLTSVGTYNVKRILPKEDLDFLVDILKIVRTLNNTIIKASDFSPEKIKPTTDKLIKLLISKNKKNTTNGDINNLNNINEED